MTSELSLYICTWNVGLVDPPKDVTSLLKLKHGVTYDLYIIGIQELSHTAVDLVRDAIFDDPWTSQLTELFDSMGYVRIHSVRLMGLHLTVFMRHSLLYYVHGVESTFTRTGLNGYWGNKGAVTVRFDIHGVSICIVNCHLTAHLPYVGDRIHDYDMIIDSQNFMHPDTKSILVHDYVFWIGDLNFRLDDIPNEKVYECIKSGNLEHLKPYDQLMKLMKEEVILLNFNEGPIEFNPTYKFDYDTDVYDTSAKNRKPGWCDRILWQVQNTSMDDVPLGVRQCHYSSHPEYCNSDHKAVSASFYIKVSPLDARAPVIFDFISTWSSNKHGQFSYSVADEMPVTKWDWIGMYKADFTHFKDYVTWVWAPIDRETSKTGPWSYYTIVLNQNYLIGQTRQYMMGYYSETRKAIMGFSNVFQIKSS